MEAEVWVVDNASQDGSLTMLKEKFPWVKIIENQDNVGFARANNQAAREASGEYVLLLNPDTLVEADTFEKVVAFMDAHPDGGGLGVKMLNGAGEFLPESKRGLPVPSVAFYKIFGLSKFFPKSKKFGSYHLTYLNNDELHSVEVLSGAFMLIRKSLFDKIGGLDEDYFMYGEDIDLSYMILKNGYKNYYYPFTRIIHYKGESTKKGSLNYVVVFYRAMRIFVEKHFSEGRSALFSWIINLAVWGRAGLSMLKRIALNLLLPVMDFVLIFCGMLAMSKYWEHAVLQPRASAFPPEFFTLVLPFYVLLMLLTVALFRGYEKPLKFSHANKGLFAGIVLTFAVYALLPETMRFSRAVLVFGAMWATLVLNGLRALLRQFNVRNYTLKDKRVKRVLVVADKEEAARLEKLVRLSYSELDFCDVVEVEASETLTSPMLLSWTRLCRADEVVFGTQTLPVKKIIDLMADLKEEHLDFKLSTPDADALVGGEGVRMPRNLREGEVNPLSHRPVQRKKRAFDMMLAFVLLIFLVVDVWFVERKSGFVKNIFRVLVGKRTWVGYASPAAATLPKLPEGVLSAAAVSSQGADLPVGLKEKSNQLYAADFSLKNDLRILKKGFYHLGN